MLARGACKAPYVIPVGGSNALGAWGYVECVREVQEQLRMGVLGDVDGGITDIAAGEDRKTGEISVAVASARGVAILTWGC